MVRTALQTSPVAGLVARTLIRSEPGWLAMRRLRVNEPLGASVLAVPDARVTPLSFSRQLQVWPTTLESTSNSVWIPASSTAAFSFIVLLALHVPATCLAGPLASAGGATARTVRAAT